MKFAILFALAVAVLAQPAANNEGVWSYCQLPNNPSSFCIEIFEPVCGVKATGLPQEYPNSCYACKASGVIAYQKGSCPQISNNCSQNPVDCRVIRMIQNPSCGFIAGQPFEDVNWFICCDTYNYSVIMHGKCPTIPTPGTNTSSPVICKPSQRNRPCDRSLVIVCANKSDSSQSDFNNPCEACSNPSVVSYVNGSCPVVEPPSNGDYVICPKNRLKFKPCPRNTSFVCAILKVGLPQTVNSCNVCFFRKYIAYLPGKCEDRVITCKKRRDCSFIKIAWIPSCAFKAGQKPYEVPNSLCCLDSNYTQVIMGKCPQAATKI